MKNKKELFILLFVVLDFILLAFMIFKFGDGEYIFMLYDHFVYGIEY